MELESSKGRGDNVGEEVKEVVGRQMITIVRTSDFERKNY